jgi:hypothetical protein
MMPIHLCTEEEVEALHAFKTIPDFLTRRQGLLYCLDDVGKLYFFGDHLSSSFSSYSLQVAECEGDDCMDSKDRENYILRQKNPIMLTAIMNDQSYDRASFDSSSVIGSSFRVFTQEVSNAMYARQTTAVHIERSVLETSDSLGSSASGHKFYQLSLGNSKSLSERVAQKTLMELDFVLSMNLKLS